MLASEAVMLRHPVLRKLWRARHAEARLLSHDTSALLVDWRNDPAAPSRTTARETTPQNTKMAAPSPQQIHPGVLKYFQEIGI